MCGIVAVVGKKDDSANPFILDGLRRLEYRGYDSYGYAIFNNLGKPVDCCHHVGSISKTPIFLIDNPKVGNVGLGHVRWASSGVVSSTNTHPVAGFHPYDKTGRICYVVHNGNVENYSDLRTELEKLGYDFYTDTDTEVISHLLHYETQTALAPGLFSESVLADAILRVMFRIQGGNSFVAYVGKPNLLVAACDGSPLVFTPEGHIASDPIAFVGYAKEYARLENGRVVINWGPDRTNIYLPERVFNEPYYNLEVPTDISIDAGTHQHFMHKEICEQLLLLKPYYGPCTFPRLKPFLLNNKICLFGCGSSYHAALVGKHYLIKEKPNLSVEVEYATELADSLSFDDDKTYIALTQSGETKDTIRAIDRLKYRNPLVITTNKQSTAASLATPIILNCGPEYGVAATKTFTWQLVALLELASFYGKDGLQFSLVEASNAIEKVISREGSVDGLAGYVNQFDNHLFLARGILYPIAMEGALKMKEVAYKHAEAIHSSEMKHGPLALIDDTTLSIFLLTYQDDEYLSKVAGNIKEIRARNGKIVVIADEKTEKAVKLAAGDETKILVLPYVRPQVQPMIVGVALQLLAYFVGVLNGINVDKPKNLCKSVSVE